jgi:hypothetical protein
MMEAASSSETSVNFCQSTRRYNPEDSHLHTRRRKNLKPYMWTCIQEILCSNLNQAITAKLLRGFPQPVHTNARSMP